MTATKKVVVWSLAFPFVAPFGTAICLGVIAWILHGVSTFHLSPPLGVIELMLAIPFLLTGIQSLIEAYGAYFRTARNLLKFRKCKGLTAKVYIKRGAPCRLQGFKFAAIVLGYGNSVKHISLLRAFNNF